MLLANSLKKYKETPESFKKMLGLVGLTTVIFFTFIILNIFFLDTKNIVDNNKASESEKKIISALPKGKLNYYKGGDGHKLLINEYEVVCKNTKIVTQRAVMGALITNYEAHQLYTDNGNLIDKYSVKWDSSTNKCFAEYTLKPLKGTTKTFTVSGEAKGFLKTSIDTRVYFIKNF